jgi:tRNA modification GTPase
MRAFLAGRLDLTQAEAVLGVIDAHDCRELSIALSQLAGGLATPLHELRDALLDLLADLEASLDFADEEIEFISNDDLQRRLADASSHVSRILAQLSARDKRDEAPRVVFVGRPNVGKSSLFNALAGESAAIVSPLAGTTRDYLVKRADADGLEVLLIDTAGAAEFGADNESIAEAAQEMMETQAAQADLQILCIDSTRSLNTWERAQVTAAGDVPRLIALTKIDAPQVPDLPQADVATSSRTGMGLSQLRRSLRQRIEAIAEREYVVVASTASRCRESLKTAANALERSHQLVVGKLGEELVAVEIRLALEELGKVVGAVYTDDVLDRIFSRFCIGK